MRLLDVQPRSVAVADGVRCALTEAGSLVVEGDDAGRFEGRRQGALLVGPANAANAAALRELFGWLRPQPLGVRSSVGLGDRIGLATPGHLQALRSSRTVLAPVLAQQSVRELDRLGRSPAEVLDAATWGAFAEGWRAGFGADADHLKTPADIDRFAGYTMYTIDPGDLVGAPVPWERLADTPRDLVARYGDERVLAAADKYGAAVAHVVSMYEHMRARVRDFDLEISVDEAGTPTTHVEHVYLATELRRLGVEWVSLAPRFVGRFEKGVDYIGDLSRFEADFAGHVGIAERLGPYKLSLHSGSDKFSVYPAVAGARVHLKTSGTSYLEALRTVAEHDPPLFRRLYAVAVSRFADERASYHVTIDGPLPAPAGASLDDPDVRRVLHVTFGSVLADGALAARVGELRDEYAANLERHIARHLRPFS